MPDYTPLFQARTLSPGETLLMRIGPLALWIQRGELDWHIAHQHLPDGDHACSMDVLDVPPDEELEWSRWILKESVDTVRVVPRLPDRPVIVRPEMPMRVMPKQSVEFFIGIPAWLSVQFGDGRGGEAVEVPTQVLSNSWFGSFTEGELCYALRTTAKLHLSQLSHSAHRVVFPLEVKNTSSEHLHFERLCLRPQFLNVYQGDHRLWTGRGRVSYRGEEKWSRIVYAATAPEFDGAGPMVGRAREALRRGALLQTFDTLKQRVDLS